MTKMIIPWRNYNFEIPYWEYLDSKTMFVFCCAILGTGVLRKCVPKKVAVAWNDSAIEAVYCVMLLLLCLSSLAGNLYNPFIYFQF